MTKYNGNLTQKQKEALEPLWQKGKENRRRREWLQKKISLEQLFFDESRTAHEEVDILDKEYAEISSQISEIYNAEDEMAKHMRVVLSEIKEVEKIAKRWGFKIYEQERTNG